MPQRRLPIPQEIKDKLLVKCKHSCCICGKFWVEIHHIDGNPSNNDESNLIPLCGYHAEMAHISPPPSARVQSITQSQLRLYKEDWIAKCNSISPTVFQDIQNLKAKIVKLEGEIKEIMKAEEGS